MQSRIAQYFVPRANYPRGTKYCTIHDCIAQYVTALRNIAIVYLIIINVYEKLKNQWSAAECM